MTRPVLTPGMLAQDEVSRRRGAGATIEAMTTKQAIHEIVDRLSEEEAERLLAYLRDEEPKEYPQELLDRVAEGTAQIARGDFVSQEEFERKYMK